MMVIVPTSSRVFYTSAKFRRLMKYLFSVLLLLLPALSACRSADEKVAAEKREAAKEIGEANKDVADTQANAAKKVQSAATVQQKEDAKVEGTLDVAEAKKKVEDEKIEATKEVTKAEVNAGQGGTYQKE